MAGRGAGAIRSARNVSLYRSRSKVRPSASSPAKATAIQRIAEATIALSMARPSSTNANEKINTHDTAKNNVVDRISRLLTSMAKSFFSTSNAIFRNMVPRTLPADHCAITASQSRRGRFVRDQPAVADDRDARHESVGQIEIVRREDDDGPFRRETAQTTRHNRHRLIVESGERLVEQHQAWAVQQRPL